MMELVEWNDSFGVGDALMDAHHRVFFELIKEFSTLPDKTDYDAIKSRIAFLVEYTIMHLCAEEALMQQANCPEFDSHKAIHEAFAMKVLTLRDSYAKAPDSLPVDGILKFMQDWFITHTKGTDASYVPCIQKLQS